MNPLLSICIRFFNVPVYDDDLVTMKLIVTSSALNVHFDRNVNQFLLLVFWIFFIFFFLLVYQLQQYVGFTITYCYV